MSYKLYLDKNNTFECDIQLHGASINNSFARVILESKDISYIFSGSIDGEGHCSVDINKLKNLFKNNDIGTMKLEVIAEDIYFNPWNSEFLIDQSKKAEVVIKEQKEDVKPIINVSVKIPQKSIIEPIPTKEIVNETIKNPTVPTNKKIDRYESKKDTHHNDNIFTLQDLKKILKK